MKSQKIKQGTRAWEVAKETRIGGSEVFDIVRYYATEEELQNCGLDAKKFKEELPFVSAWALYHKLINDDVYQKPLLEPEYAEYGLAMETYGLNFLQKDRTNKLCKGKVFMNDKLIASLDISGISEEIDVRPFDFGNGIVRVGEKFVCEQKTISPFKDSLPLKYVIQAQYQLILSNSKFFILQAMILDNDTPFERGKIVSLAETSKKKFLEYVQDKVKVQHIYFNYNDALAQLIKVCLDRFFNAVENRIEPTPYVQVDKVSSIIKCVRQNSFYNPDLIKKFDLSDYVQCKKNYDEADRLKKEALQKIIEFAIANNCSRFVGDDGYSASFSSDGKFLVREPKEPKCSN